uniref:receptor protein-tyrosine kinase n=1 Tax=Echinococcus multilocularis TaxID=6211 RepID=Q8T0W6_ECHMU|nr:putative insulin receptor [Echinococcus multilocularis]
MPKSSSYPVMCIGSYVFCLFFFQLSVFVPSYCRVFGGNHTYLQQNEMLCGDFDVRRPSALSRIKSCTVIEGNLLIVMTRLPVNASIPNLREITGFLVIYDLMGLDGLATLFPNLTVIRGRSLISNFALVIRSTSLKTIGLPSLRVIQRGGVRVDLNTNLCYVRTVNWSYILGDQTAAAAPVRLLTNRLICPDTCQPECAASTPEAISLTELEGTSREKDAKLGHCWSLSYCQSICSANCTSRGIACRMDNTQLCCHKECLAGCYGPGPEACVACKGALHRGVCVSQCPPSAYLFHGRRCVTAAECFNMSSTYRLPHVAGSSGSSSIGFAASVIVNTTAAVATTAIRQFAIHQGRCVPDCPSGHQRDEVSGQCVPCGDECPRIRCHHMLISSLKSLSKLKDCFSVTDLYISIHEGDTVLIQQQFDEAFSSLREVESIKVVRATALTSLAFLRHVKRINTIPNSSPNVTVIEIRGNDNLLELWPPPTRNQTGGLQVVSEGLVHFILNRYLCPKKITDLVRTGALTLPGGRNFRIEELELAEATNGKLGFCETTQISLELKDVFSSTAAIQWPRFFDNRTTGQAASTLVLVFFQATTKNLTVYTNRLSCGDDSWKMIPSICNTSTIREEKGENVAFCSKILTGLQPATRYAVYVESKTLFSQRGAISNIVYFTTNPSKPSHPRMERLQALNDSRISVRWSPPQYNNGLLAVYLLWFRSIHIDPEPYLYRDFCFLTPDWLSSAITPSYHVGTSRLTGIYWSHIKSYPDLCLDRRRSSPASHESLWMVDAQDDPLPVVFGNRLSRVLQDGEVGLFVLNVVEDGEIYDNGISVVVQAGKKSFTSTLSHLRSFSQYIVELQACQKPCDNSDFPWTDLMKPESGVEIELTEKWNNYLSHYCSHKVFKTQRTLPAAGADSVNFESIRSEQDAAGTVYVSWAEPTNPNGVILHYVLRYRRVEQAPALKASATKTPILRQNKSESKKPVPESELSSGSTVWSTLCVTRASWQLAGFPGNGGAFGGRGGGLLGGSGTKRHMRSVVTTPLEDSRLFPGRNFLTMASFSQQPNSSLGGAELLNLLPGFYELQIMAVSLAGNSSWTPPLLFEVTTSPIDTIITVTAICVSVVSVLLALVIAYIIHRIRKKRLMDSEWNSPNPEYWHVYEVDDWEMQLEDIDTLNFRHPLGRGNFGMVYRGFVKSLRTPAHCFYTEPHNIPAAIKTLSSACTVFDRRDFITEACYMKQFQSFHIVRLFGIVSKCSPSSAVPAAARTFLSGGSGSGSGDGGGGFSSAQTKFRFSLFRLFGGGGFWRRHRPKRQAVPVPIKKKLFSLSAEEAMTGNTGNGGSLTRTARTPSNEGFNTSRGPDGSNGTTDASPTKRVWTGSGRLGRGSFSRLLMKNQKDFRSTLTTQDETGVATVQRCSSSDSIRPFSQYGLFVVMELMESGDLASYLRKLGDSGIGFVKPAQAYLWAVQIADGMAYLERKKYVHRDLAARNCLVDGRGVVKVGDFGLCRDIYERNYYHKVGAGKLPVRWMAPESLQSAYFTSRSDVWSFGVVLWEIATMACLPYQGMSHNEVISYVLDGNTLVSGGAPINCPPLLQSVMLYCWSYRPAQRPTFLHLLYLLAPRFADADFRQASYFYVGDTFTQQPPPCQDFEKSTSNSAIATTAPATGFADLPSLIKTVLGPPYGAGGSGGSNSLSEDYPYPAVAVCTASASRFHNPSYLVNEQSVERLQRRQHQKLEDRDAAGDGCSLDDGDGSSC